MDLKKTGLIVLVLVLLLGIIALFAVNSSPGNNDQIGSNTHATPVGLTRNVTNLDGTIFTVPQKHYPDRMSQRTLL